MVKFQLSDIAEHLEGRLSGPDVEVDGAVTDSRADVDGRLFVPLVAERDGHDFIDGAVAAGSAAYLTSRPLEPGLPASAVEVSDTAQALSAIGKLARSRISGPVVGITGSVGKTSVKDLALAACRGGGVAWASEASFNNEIGVPLTLANGPGGDAVTIVEMGARGVGHIAELCEVAKPTIGVVTRVALVHSELFGSLEAVAQGKGELIESIDSDGVAVLNADDPLVARMKERTTARVLTYGTAGISVAEVSHGPVELDGELRPRFTVESPWGSAEMGLQVRGAHMADNATAALAVALMAGVEFDQAVAGLEQANLSRWRMQVFTNKSGVTVINDAYNANPTSMRAALSALSATPASRRVAVLGAMAELGEESEAEHLQIASEAVAADIEVLAVDAPEYGDAVTHMADHESAVSALDGLGAGVAVLLKGSRVAGLERVAEALLEE